MALRSQLRAERAGMCDTLEDLGPSAPTLCTGWTSRHLAAHLGAEDRFGGLPVLLLVPLVGVAPRRYRTAIRHRAVGGGVMERLRRREFGTLVEGLRRGPGPFLRLRGLAPFFLLENWMHHEDLRRANQLPQRTMEPSVDRVLWRLMPIASRRAGLPRDLTVVLRTPDGREHRTGARSSSGVVTLEGDVGELLLYLGGRREVATVSATGDPEALTRFGAVELEL